MGDDERAFFFEGDGGGAGEQIASDPVCDLAECVTGTWDDDHAVMLKGAGSDGCSDIVDGVVDDVRVISTGEEVEVGGADVEFVVEKSAAELRDDEMDFDFSIEEGANEGF